MKNKIYQEGHKYQHFVKIMIFNWDKSVSEQKLNIEITLQCVPLRGRTEIYFVTVKHINSTQNQNIIIVIA